MEDKSYFRRMELHNKSLIKEFFNLPFRLQYQFPTAVKKRDLWSKKILSMPCSSTSSSSEQADASKITIAKKNHHFKHFSSKFFQRLAKLELKACIRCFTYEELKRATKRFSTNLLIEEGENSQVYHAILDDGHASVVKVLKASRYTEENLCREVEMLSGLKHENIVQLLGYCWSKEMYAVVYNLLDTSLKQRQKQLNCSERMKVAVGVAKALEYLHSCNPPIIHRDVKSSNILLSEDCTPQLSDFGAAAVHDLQTQESISACKKPIHVIGTFGYLAPEYVMYGKVDEKIDVYSYGVILLELITGKEATLTNPSPNQECLVLWARSLLTCGLSERLIDPNLNEDCDRDGMKIMMIVARLCLLHSSSRRPTMKKILHLMEEPDRWLEMQKVRD